jgi:hypothetical protein
LFYKVSKSGSPFFVSELTEYVEGFVKEYDHNVFLFLTLNGQPKTLKAFTVEAPSFIFVYSGKGAINKYLDFLRASASLRFNLLA